MADIIKRKKERQDSGNASSDSQTDVGGDKSGAKKVPWSKRQKQQEKLRHYGKVVQ